MGDVSQLKMAYPSTPQGVKVTSANATVGDFDVHIILRPSLRLKLLPDHLPTDGILIQPHPSLERVLLCAHLGLVDIVFWIGRFLQMFCETKYPLHGCGYRTIYPLLYV